MSQNLLDIFSGDAFSTVTLTDALKEMCVVPGRLGEMGLFNASSVQTLEIAIERVGDTIQLVPPTPRGGPGGVRDMEKRTIQNLRIPHFQRDWSVYADEVQGVREFGSELAFRTVQNLTADKIATEVRDLDVTEEYARLGAVQGVVTYKGGDTLDLFTEFGIAQPSEVDFDLDNASPASGALRKKCAGMVRATRKALGGLPFDSLHALVGDNFFDDLLSHIEVRETYKNWSEAQILRDSYVGKNRAKNPIFEFGGIVWENYGAIDDTGDAALMGIGANLAKFFPVGVPSLFRTYYAPADYTETVNRPGQRLYAKQWPMPNGKGVFGEVQMNALSICTRPGALMSARRS